jgi:hypothetical protein
MGTVCDSATSNTPFYARHVPPALVYGHSVRHLEPIPSPSIQAVRQNA